MHLFHIPQCSIQNKNVHISVLNGALWYMEQVRSGICELGLNNMACKLWRHFQMCESRRIFNQFSLSFVSNGPINNNQYWVLDLPMPCGPIY